MVVTLLTSPATITNMEAFAALGHLTCHAITPKVGEALSAWLNTDTNSKKGGEA